MTQHQNQIIQAGSLELNNIGSPKSHLSAGVSSPVNPLLPSQNIYNQNNQKSSFTFKKHHHKNQSISKMQDLTNEDLAITKQYYIRSSKNSIHRKSNDFDYNQNNLTEIGRENIRIIEPFDSFLQKESSFVQNLKNSIQNNYKPLLSPKMSLNKPNDIKRIISRFQSKAELEPQQLLQQQASLQNLNMQSNLRRKALSPSNDYYKPPCIVKSNKLPSAFKSNFTQFMNQDLNINDKSQLNKLQINQIDQIKKQQKNFDESTKIQQQIQLENNKLINQNQLILQTQPDIDKDIPQQNIQKKQKIFKYPMRKFSEEDSDINYNELSRIVSQDRDIGEIKKTPSRQNLQPLRSPHYRQTSQDFQDIQGKLKQLEVDIKPQLNQLVTLNFLKNSYGEVSVKKVFHVNSLKLFVVKEQNIENMDTNIKMKTWLYLWKECFKRYPYLVQINELFWNSPEGHTSILLEYVDGCSLKEIIESCGLINQSCLSEIGEQIIKALQIIQRKTKQNYGGLHSSHVLFTSQGGIKLSPAPSIKFSDQNQNQMNISTFQRNRKLFYNYYADIQNQDKEDKRDLLQSDAFDLGYLLFECVFGSMITFEPQNIEEINPQLSSFQKEIQSQTDRNASSKKNIQALLSPSRMTSKLKQNCCIIHIIKTQVKKGKTPELFPLKQSYQLQQILSNSDCELIVKILEQFFDINFENFLCQCLRFDAFKRPNIDQLIVHPFITQSLNSNIQLKEIVNTTVQIIKKINILLPTQFILDSEKQILKICNSMRIVLSNQNDELHKHNLGQKILLKLTVDSPLIQEINKQFGINKNTIINMLQNAIKST